MENTEIWLIPMTQMVTTWSKQVSPKVWASDRSNDPLNQYFWAIMRVCQVAAFSTIIRSFFLQTYTQEIVFFKYFCIYADINSNLQSKMISNIYWDLQSPISPGCQMSFYLDISNSSFKDLHSAFTTSIFH